MSAPVEMSSPGNAFREGLEPAPTNARVATGNAPQDDTAREKVLPHATRAFPAELAGQRCIVRRRGGHYRAGAPSCRALARSRLSKFRTLIFRPAIYGRTARGLRILRDMVARRLPARPARWQPARQDRGLLEAIAESLRTTPKPGAVLLPESRLPSGHISFESASAPRLPMALCCCTAARRASWREGAAGRAASSLARLGIVPPLPQIETSSSMSRRPSSKRNGVIYHARDLGVLRASMDLLHRPRLATPSLSHRNAQLGTYSHIKLSARPALRPASIALADMLTAPPEAGRWIGRISPLQSRRRWPRRNRRSLPQPAGYAPLFSVAPWQP